MLARQKYMNRRFHQISTAGDTDHHEFGHDSITLVPFTPILPYWDDQATTLIAQPGELDWFRFADKLYTSSN